MARIGVSTAVEARIAASWASISNCPLVDENTKQKTPKGGSAFLVVQYPYSTASRISFGNPGANTHREEGAFRLVIHVERGSGSTLGRQLAGELESLFLDKHFGGVETFTPQSAASDDDNDDGQYFVYAVAVPYRFDFLG